MRARRILCQSLQKILEHFKELESLDTKNVPPMAGGSLETNVLREDEERKNTDKGKGVESFPNNKNNFLKIPPVFE